jgi:glycosyltransferase involved in cell wall biosynthesis
MKLLFALTYYYPHVSGLTIFVKRLAEALAARGHTVTVLTSQHEGRLARAETHNGVRIVRVPVAFRVGKGPVMPSYAKIAPPLVRAHDLVLLNLPCTPVESVLLPILTRTFARRPLVAAYFCDVRLPEGIFNRVLDEGVFLGNASAGLLATRIVTLTDDYAMHSRFLKLFRRKLEIIPPGVQMSAPAEEDVEAFRRRCAPAGERLIGVAARFAAEKGVEYLLEALPRIREAIPSARILFTGDRRMVVGEERYWERMQPLVAAADDRCEFLGQLDWREMAAFYGACDATVLPSVNSTEAFGLAQVESMLCGTPVVASDLPGVRVPLRSTGMGRLVPPRDARALADAIIEVIRNRPSYVRPRAQVEKLFPFEAMVRQYETLFERLLRGR